VSSCLLRRHASALAADASLYFTRRAAGCGLGFIPNAEILGLNIKRLSHTRVPRVAKGCKKCDDPAAGWQTIPESYPSHFIKPATVGVILDSQERRLLFWRVIANGRRSKASRQAQERYSSHEKDVCGRFRPKELDGRLGRVRRDKTKQPEPFEASCRLSPAATRDSSKSWLNNGLIYPRRTFPPCCEMALLRCRLCPCMRGARTRIGEPRSKWLAFAPPEYVGLNCDLYKRRDQRL